MAVDVSKRAFELFSGAKRARLLPTLAIALVVTGLVVVPLVMRASDEAFVATVDSASMVLVDTGEAAPMPLDQAAVAGSVLISVNDPSASAVSFNLFAAGSQETLLASQDLEGATFDLVVGETGDVEPLDTTVLSNGDYELFLTIATPDGERRTAVGFSVANP